MMNTAPEDWSARSRELALQLSRAALGDRAAFKRLYDLSSGHLFAVILRIQRRSEERRVGKECRL